MFIDPIGPVAEIAAITTVGGRIAVGHVVGAVITESEFYDCDTNTADLNVVYEVVSGDYSFFRTLDQITGIY